MLQKTKALFEILALEEERHWTYKRDVKALLSCWSYDVQCWLGLGYSFLAFIFLSDFVLYSPLSVIVWIPVGIFIIRSFDSQERELPTLSENSALKPPEASTDV